MPSNQDFAALLSVAMVALLLRKRIGTPLLSRPMPVALLVMQTTPGNEL
ncbi:hypothetical protein [Hymenobacter volaticus]|uniref:Uncharacterized protein n=1 Tax=Hymenobacter volaticus TaxID=2932254 RepID=A0ABY4G3P0_9BACT|nr:hypothetical protein [Hymenobacter volaticus]UOQ65462.1 hypothetical protein MUN86_18210 [Hymenobacter volaticus]